MDVLRRHFDLVLEANRTLNLTRVTEPEEAVRKLYLASFAPVPALVAEGRPMEGFRSLLDLGTGAGFPGVPLVVAAPHLSATLVDSRGKKAVFLAAALATLGLSPRVVAVKGRGIEMPHTHPATEHAFGLVTARAVGRAAEVVREAHGLMRSGGILVIAKGPELTDDEIREGEREAQGLGLRFLGVRDVAVEDLTPRILLYRR
ncbi:MAG: class I SAM-dependent methyltransferase [Planctomycetes bacterium]|nr:class I SAM-dependent methyltransferase [Planctomycetota bacterium]